MDLEYQDQLQRVAGDLEARDPVPLRPPPKLAEPPRGTANHWRRPAALLAALLLAGLLAAAGALYWDYTGHFEQTDDAFVAARQFAIAPKIPGYITAVPVTDNQHVAAGEVIARIDD